MIELLFYWGLLVWCLINANLYLRSQGRYNVPAILVFYLMALAIIIAQIINFVLIVLYSYKTGNLTILIFYDINYVIGVTAFAILGYFQTGTLLQLAIKLKYPESFQAKVDQVNRLVYTVSGLLVFIGFFFCTAFSTKFKFEGFAKAFCVIYSVFLSVVTVSMIAAYWFVRSSIKDSFVNHLRSEIKLLYLFQVVFYLLATFYTIWMDLTQAFSKMKFGLVMSDIVVPPVFQGAVISLILYQHNKNFGYKHSSTPSQQQGPSEQSQKDSQPGYDDEDDSN